MSNEYILTIILLSFNIFAFGIGYLIGRIGSINGVYHYQDHKKTESFFDKEKPKNSSISIDSKKIVTNISTDGLEKKYSDIAETKQSEENISSSINKLKNMKG